jgi:hypothetical protein
MFAFQYLHAWIPPGGGGTPVLRVYGYVRQKDPLILRFSSHKRYTFSDILSHKRYTFSDILSHKRYTFLEIPSRKRYTFSKLPPHKAPCAWHFLTRGMLFFHKISLTRGMVFHKISLTRGMVFHKISHKRYGFSQNLSHRRSQFELWCHTYIPLLR